MERVASRKAISKLIYPRAEELVKSFKNVPERKYVYNGLHKITCKTSSFLVKELSWNWM